MMIRIKHEGKCRKIAQAPKTIEELKAKITELFGGSATKLEVTYKDCDGELVSVFDTEDLKNCFEEAETYKMTCVTLLLKSGSSSSRSMSSKKRSQTITESDSKDVNTDSDEQEGFKVVGKQPLAASPEDEKAILKVMEQKAMVHSELLKKKLLEEHQKALEQLEADTNSKIERIHSKKDRKHHSENKGCKMEAMMKQKKFMMKMRALNQFCMAENIENPMMTTNTIFKSLKEEFPQLACNPALLNMVINDATESIRNNLKQSCQKIITQNPELAKAGEQNKGKYGEIKERVKENCQRKERHAGESNDKDARRAAKHAMRDEMKGRKSAERDARKLQKDAEKAEKHARKAEEKQTRVCSRGGPVTEEERNIKSKVHALKDIFTNSRKPQLRAIVEQNPTLSVLELVPLIKATKIAKSN
jgi:hypothetical protein